MNIEACVQSPIFKNPAAAIFCPETYQEGLEHLQFSCQKSTQASLTLTDRIKHIVYGLCLLIPIINAIALFILQKLYSQTFLKTFLPIYNTVASSMTGIKMEFLLPAAASLGGSYYLATQGKYKLAIACILNATLMTIHATLGLFIPRDVKLLTKINDKVLPPI